VWWDKNTKLMGGKPLHRMVSVAGKLCHFMEAQKVEYLQMPAWYERRVESAIAWGWRKARWCAKGSLLTQEPELVPSLLLGRGDGTEVSADETRNPQ